MSDNVKSENVSDVVVPEIVPVILAGGRGTRLWPLTSSKRPKPFLKVFSKFSFLQDTTRRVVCFSAPLFVTETAFLPSIERDLEEIGVKARNIIVEPVGRNTGPAVAAAALILQRQCQNAGVPEPLMLVMPSDHYIDDPVQFQNDVRYAATRHQEGSVTLLGAMARGGSAQFGYIVPDMKKDGPEGRGEKFFKKVLRFVEKPDAQVARRLIHDEYALWHSGMFLCYPSDLIVFLSKTSRGLLSGVDQSLPEEGKGASGTICLNSVNFVNIPLISIDYTLLEKLDCCYVSKIHVYWSDVGTRWSLLRSIFGKMLGAYKQTFFQ